MMACMVNEAWIIIYYCSIIRQMAADTFGLLSVCCGNSQFLTPFHFFALLDPRAQWFRKWMVRHEYNIDHFCLADYTVHY